MTVLLAHPTGNEIREEVKLRENSSLPLGLGKSVPLERSPLGESFEPERRLTHGLLERRQIREGVRG